MNISCPTCEKLFSKEILEHIEEGEIPHHYDCYFQSHPTVDEPIEVLENRIIEFMRKAA